MNRVYVFCDVFMKDEPMTSVEIKKSRHRASLKRNLNSLLPLKRFGMSVFYESAEVIYQAYRWTRLNCGKRYSFTYDINYLDDLNKVTTTEFVIVHHYINFNTQSDAIHFALLFKDKLGSLK